MNARKLAYLGCHPSSARVLSLFMRRPIGPPVPLKFGIAPWYFPLSSTFAQHPNQGTFSSKVALLRAAGSCRRSRRREARRGGAEERPHQLHHLRAADRVAVRPDVNLPLRPCAHRPAGRAASQRRQKRSICASCLGGLARNSAVASRKRQTQVPRLVPAPFSSAAADTPAASA